LEEKKEERAGPAPHERKGEAGRKGKKRKEGHVNLKGKKSPGAKHRRKGKEEKEKGGASLVPQKKKKEEKRSRVQNHPRLLSRAGQGIIRGGGKERKGRPTIPRRDSVNQGNWVKRRKRGGGKKHFSKEKCPYAAQSGGKGCGKEGREKKKKENHSWGGKKEGGRGEYPHP